MDEVDALQPLLILVSFGIFDTASVHAKEGCLPTVLSRQLVHLLCSWAACRSEISIEVDDHWFAFAQEVYSQSEGLISEPTSFNITMPGCSECIHLLSRVETGIDSYNPGLL
eukprot:TRINITY_DN15401_c0_g1_i3.p1 TRINITY_DN15401_c0_g1~~TRINITY_DN15401_c0_g1_i3.p1  ORF type:complete len:112 (-),score=2.60 TRINITY_DN15401_c0_g1_i3:310-645(-)